MRFLSRNGRQRHDKSAGQVFLPLPVSGQCHGLLKMKGSPEINADDKLSSVDSFIDNEAEIDNQASICYIAIGINDHYRYGNQLQKGDLDMKPLLIVCIVASVAFSTAAFAEDKVADPCHKIRHA
ncbi:MAG TPA: hypothetical protein VEI28_03580, partial [Thermodesulfovibrionales bacterium]|nr:hypothetical protein [Thermodesulfovibrionales bacterium]